MLNFICEMYFQTLKLRPQILLILLLLLFFFAAKVEARQIEARVKILSPVKVRVEGKFNAAGAAPRNWSFLQNYADVTNLGARVGNLKFFNADREIGFKKLVAGEFETEEIPASFEYEVKTEIPAEPTAAAHVSWLSETGGLLMLNDLLPQNLHDLSARIVLEMPSEWRAATSETTAGANVFDVENVGKAVFAVGKDWRAESKQIGETRLNFAAAGQWQFTDAEAFETAERIAAEHQKIFGEMPFPKTQILLLPFPQTAGGGIAFDRWRAETRGSTVIILSAPPTFKSAALNRLHEQLRHEIFHLWIPNAVNLSGSYDWFYEGFTLYQALKTGVRLNQIRFDDFLSTLGRAYDLTEALSRRRSVSLIEASEKRWMNTGGELIYAKGLIVAFLCDARLLRSSGGRRELDSIFREVFQKHRRPQPKQDGSRAILSILKRNAEVVSLVENYVEGDSKIEWTEDLALVGLAAEKTSGATRVKVVAAPNRRQKDLLDKLGYNQWRKLSGRKPGG